MPSKKYIEYNTIESVEAAQQLCDQLKDSPNTPYTIYIPHGGKYYLMVDDDCEQILGIPGTELNDNFFS